MNPRIRGGIAFLIFLGVVLGLFLLFPPALAFVEMAARELRYLWWLILLVALAFWLLWSANRKPKG